jgi:hypothetical protein
MGAGCAGQRLCWREMVLGGVAEEEERMGTEEAHGIDFGIKYSHLVSMVLYLLMILQCSLSSLIV